jgi:IclR family mhp operon transcriptional activator
MVLGRLQDLGLVGCVNSRPVAPPAPRLNRQNPYYGIESRRWFRGNRHHMPLSSPRPIEPVERAFAVLESLNRVRTGTLSEISEATALPKPTTARLLETLIALGYVTRVSRKIGYRITDRVLALAAGVRYVDRLVHAAAPEMSAFTAKTGWPVYLGTISDAIVLIRHSTAEQSPMSFETVGYDRKFQIYESALGLAYLGFCSIDERRTIISAIRLSDGVTPLSAPRLRGLELELERIRARGYAFTRSSRPRRVNGLGVPIGRGEQVLGALTLRYPKRAMSDDEAASRYARPLAELADRIALAALAERSGA